MKAKYKAFILPHIGDSFAQCADRFNYSEEKQSFAIVDGVGNSLFPDAWAELVSSDYVENPDNFFSEGPYLVRESELIGKWNNVLNERIQNLSEEERFIFEMGLDKADFAACTFVGLQFRNGEWYCDAIGDSYLFTIDNDYNVQKAVASMQGQEFDNFPEYFASKHGMNHGTVVSESGNLCGVYRFALMTDALSDWFLSKDTDKEQRKQLLDINSHEEYQTFIDSLRQSKNLKDDDTTMVVITIEDDGNQTLCVEKECEIDNIRTLIGEENAQEVFLTNCEDKSKDQSIDDTLDENLFNEAEKVLQHLLRNFSSEKKNASKKERKVFSKVIEYIEFIINIIHKYGTSNERTNNSIY